MVRGDGGIIAAACVNRKPRAHRPLTFFQFLHGGNDQPLGVFDLLHNQPNVHRRELRLALATAIHAVLANESERVGENIERGCQAPAYGAHLKFISFFGFLIMLEHVAPDDVGAVYDRPCFADSMNNGRS